MQGNYSRSYTLICVWHRNDRLFACFGNIFAPGKQYGHAAMSFDLRLTENAHLRIGFGEHIFEVGKFDTVRIPFHYNGP